MHYFVTISFMFVVLATCLNIPFISIHPDYLPDVMVILGGGLCPAVDVFWLNDGVAPGIPITENYTLYLRQALGTSGFTCKKKLTKWIPSALKKLRVNKTVESKSHSVFGIEDLVQQEKPDKILIEPVTYQQHDQAIRMLKDHYLKEHVLVRTRGMHVMQDNALDEYLYSLLKQGHTVYAKTYDGTPVGICVNIASSPEDPKILRDYAYYRQDSDTKEFLNFTAKLLETPNLWEVFEVPKIFEIKMLAVIPEYRRRGLATMLAETSNDLAESQSFEVVRMDCINPHDFKIAERLLFHCMAMFPLHALRARARVGSVRVYVGARTRDHPDKELKRKRRELESLIE